MADQNGDRIFDEFFHDQTTISLNGDDLKLANGFVLSMKKSSRKRLVWEKGGQSMIWSCERPMGVRQVTLKLDCISWLREYDEYEDEPYLFNFNNYNFEIMNLEARLVFKLDCMPDDDHDVDYDVGAYFGIPRSDVNVFVRAITCRVQVDLWDPKGRTWLNLFRPA